MIALSCTDRVPLDQQEVSAALLKVASRKKTAVKESQEDKGDKRMGHSDDAQQPISPIHHQPVPPRELRHPYAERAAVPTAPASLAKQQLLLPPDPPPAGKVCD